MVSPGVNGEPVDAKRWGSPALLVLWGAIGVGALLLLAKSVQNSSAFDRLQPWILLLNVIGVIALVDPAGAQVVAARPRLSRARSRLAADGPDGDVFSARWSSRRC